MDQPPPPPSRRRRRRPLSSVVVVRRRPSKYYLQEWLFNGYSLFVIFVLTIRQPAIRALFGNTRYVLYMRLQFLCDGTYYFTSLFVKNENNK